MYTPTTKDKRMIRDRFAKVVCKRDGTIEIRQGYFYRHGMTAEKMENKVLKYIPTATIVESGDNWQPWPKDSYFWVQIRLTEPVMETLERIIEEV